MPLFVDKFNDRGDSGETLITHLTEDVQDILRVVEPGRQVEDEERPLQVRLLLLRFAPFQPLRGDGSGRSCGRLLEIVAGHFVKAPQSVLAF